LQTDLKISYTLRTLSLEQRSTVLAKSMTVLRNAASEPEQTVVVVVVDSKLLNAADRHDVVRSEKWEEYS